MRQTQDFDEKRVDTNPQHKQGTTASPVTRISRRRLKAGMRDRETEEDNHLRRHKVGTTANLGMRLIRGEIRMRHHLLIQGGDIRRNREEGRMERLEDMHRHRAGTRTLLSREAENHSHLQDKAETRTHLSRVGGTRMHLHSNMHSHRERVTRTHLRNKEEIRMRPRNKEETRTLHLHSKEETRMLHLRNKETRTHLHLDSKAETRMLRLHNKEETRTHLHLRVETHMASLEETPELLDTLLQHPEVNLILLQHLEINPILRLDLLTSPILRLDLLPISRITLQVHQVLLQLTRVIQVPRVIQVVPSPTALPPTLLSQVTSLLPKVSLTVRLPLELSSLQLRLSLAVSPNLVF